jgi:hypothetical protein
MAARLFAEFTSDNQIDYVVEIHDTQFFGAATKINNAGDGFQLKWDGITDEVYSRIIGSSVSFSIYDEGQQSIADFLTVFKQYQEDRFFIVIYREADARYVNNIVNVTTNFEDRVAADGGTVESPTCYRSDITELGGTFRYIGPIADHIYWYGWLVQDLVAIEDQSNPTLLQLQAVDGISKMKDSPYEYDGSTRSFTNHLYNFINDNTPASHLDDTLVMFRTISNYWAQNHTYSLTSDPLSLTRFPTKVYANYTDIGTIQYSNALDILQEMCVVMGARFYFDDGCFRFEQFSQRAENELREFKYLMTGVADGYDDVAVDFDVDQTAIARSQGNFRFLPALNKIQLTDVKKANANLLGGTVTYDSQFGDEINVGLVPSANNGRIYLEMTSRFQTFISTPLTGAAVPVFAVTIRLEPEDGSANLYWSNALVSGVTSFGAGSWSATLGTYKWAANSVTRSQNTTTLTKHTMITGPLLKDGDIYLDITILGFYDASGSSTSFFTGGNSFNWAVTLNKARFENDNSSAAIGEVIGFSTNGNSKIKSNLTLDLGETRLFNGSGELGSLYAYNGTSWVPSGGWRVGNTGTYENTSSLVTSDLMKFHNNPIERWEGRIIYPENFYSLLRFDSHEWIALRATLVANSDELEGEWFRISEDTTNISIGTPIDVVDTDFGNNDAADAVGHYANISIGDIGGMNIDSDNVAIGPFSETATGGKITGSALITGDTTLESTLEHQGKLIQQITDVTHSSGSTYNVQDTEYMIFNTWTGGNGTATINLPRARDNEGRLLRFKSDGTISSNKSIALTPVSPDTIDGDPEFTFNRDFDGVMVLAHNDNWFIIQRKAK